jgi:dolichol-phosphate mannosyltransferase
MAVAARPLVGLSSPQRGSEPALSVVIPLNNEERNVRPLLRELRAVLAHRRPYELIVVDDGSSDATATEVRRFAKEDGPLRLLSHNSQRGQSTAIYNGIRAARADVVVVLDGDLQNDPADIERLLEAYSADADRASLGLLIGHRVQRRDSALRRLSSRVANAVRASVLHDATPDTGCGLKLIRRSVFTRLPYFDHMHRFLPALVQRAGLRVVSLPVQHRPRLEGRAHYGMWDRLWVGLIDMEGVAWLTRRSCAQDFREETGDHGAQCPMARHRFRRASRVCRPLPGPVARKREATPQRHSDDLLVLEHRRRRRVVAVCDP